MYGSVRVQHTPAAVPPERVVRAALGVLRRGAAGRAGLPARHRLAAAGAAARAAGAAGKEDR